jgi:hypothetical protein
MQRFHRYLGSVLLSATLVAPLAVIASPKPQSKEERKEEKREEKRERKRAKRYYDRERHDYHVWDSREDAAYRRWWMEERREREMRDFARLRREQQLEYWRWRHIHPD